MHSILASNLPTRNAFIDYQTLIDTVPQSESLYWEAKNALRVLEPRVEEVKKRDMDKMMGQLKTVGNSVLGKSPRGPLFMPVIIFVALKVGLG